MDPETHTQKQTKKIWNKDIKFKRKKINTQLSSKAVFKIIIKITQFPEKTMHSIFFPVPKKSNIPGEVSLFLVLGVLATERQYNRMRTLVIECASRKMKGNTNHFSSAH